MATFTIWPHGATLPRAIWRGEEVELFSVRQHLVVEAQRPFYRTVTEIEIKTHGRFYIVPPEELKEINASNENHSS